MEKDTKDLNLLKLFHYIVGGIGCLFSCFPLIHLTLGLLLVSNKIPLENQSGNELPDAFAWLFVIMGGMFFLFGQASSICIILSGRYIKQTKNYMFSFIIACISCLFFPFGTVLGVFTIIVFSRNSVKKRYEDQKQLVA